ncbi:FliM/FliN family flagellar motor C-terminal domain-containing protein [Nitratifractor sp.]
MANIQLERLNRSLLREGPLNRPLLVTEPLSMSRKKLAKLRVGDRIDLGAEPPAFYVRNGESYPYRVRLVESEGQEACLLEGSGPSWLGAEREGKKRSVLEGRLATLPAKGLKRGTVLCFPWKLTEHIHLYEEDRPLATAALVVHEGGYALKVTELHDGR